MDKNINSCRIPLEIITNNFKSESFDRSTGFDNTNRDFYSKTKEVNDLFAEIENNDFSLKSNNSNTETIEINKISETKQNSKNNCNLLKRENDSFTKPMKSRFISMHDSSFSMDAECELDLRAYPLKNLNLEIKNEKEIKSDCVNLNDQKGDFDSNTSLSNAINDLKKDLLGNKIVKNGQNIISVNSLNVKTADQEKSAQSVKSSKDVKHDKLSKSKINQALKSDQNSKNNKKELLNNNEQPSLSNIYNKNLNNPNQEYQMHFNTGINSINNINNINHVTNSFQYPVFDSNYNTNSSVQSSITVGNSFNYGANGFGYQPWNNYIHLPPFIPCIQSSMVGPDIYLQVVPYSTGIDYNYPAYAFNNTTSNMLIPYNMNMNDSISNNSNININNNNNINFNNNNYNSLNIKQETKSVKTLSTAVNSEKVSFKQYNEKEKIVNKENNKEISKETKINKDTNKLKSKRNSKEEEFMPETKKSTKSNKSKENKSTKDKEGKPNKDTFKDIKDSIEYKEENREQAKDLGIGISYINLNNYGLSNCRKNSYSNKNSHKTNHNNNSYITNYKEAEYNKEKLQDEEKSSSSLNELIKLSNDELIDFLLTKHGSKMMQNAIISESTNMISLDKLVEKLLTFDFTELIMSSYSSFFFEKSVQYFSFKQRKALISSPYFKSNFVSMCCGKYSNIVIQSFIKCMSGNPQEEYEEILYYKLIFSNLSVLIPDQYGNFVLNQVFYCFKPENKYFLFDYIHNNLINLATFSQYGHYLIKNFIKYFNLESGNNSVYKCCQAKYPENTDFVEKQRLMLVDEVVQDLEALAVHKYGHFVLVDLIELWGISFCSQIVEKFTSNIQDYWKVVYGYSITKRIFLVNYHNEVSLNILLTFFFILILYYLRLLSKTLVNFC